MEIEMTENEKIMFESIKELFKLDSMFRAAICGFAIALSAAVRDGRSQEFLIEIRDLIIKMQNEDYFNIEANPLLTKENKGPTLH